MTLTNMFPRFVPVDSQDISDKIVTEAAADGHAAPIQPSYYLEKDGEIAGTVSILNMNNGMCMVSIWAHSKRVTARDTLMCLAIIENFCRMVGYKHIYMPCSTTSPYWDYMSKMGYTETNPSTKYFIKPI
jgi:hypothetical protein